MPWRRMGRGGGCIDPHFLSLGPTWRWEVSFTPRLLYPRGKSLRYPLDRRLGGLHSQSGRRGEEKILDHTRIRTLIPRSSSNSDSIASNNVIAGSILDGFIGFLNWPNPSSRTMALGSTQPLTVMSTRYLPAGKGRPAERRVADNLTAICEPTV
jgi:hypothetical protein